MKMKGDIGGGVTVLVILAGVVLCMTRSAWFPWLNFAGLLIAVAGVVYLKKRPAQETPGFQRTTRGGTGQDIEV